MKPLVFALAVTAALGAATPGLAQDDASRAAAVEIGYAKDSLGYAALMSGEYETAIAQIQAAEPRDLRDPARLINMGYAYRKLGRDDLARSYFEAAVRSPRDFDIVLADDSVMNSRDAARVALRQLQRRSAQR